MGKERVVAGRVETEHEHATMLGGGGGRVGGID